MHERKYDTGMLDSKIIFYNNLYNFYETHQVEYQIKSYTKLKIMNMLFREVLFEIIFLNLK